MKEIIGLTIEDPYVRRILGDCKRACERLRSLTEDTNLDADIRKWASRSLCAIENEQVHNLWSKVITGVFSEQEMQHLLDRSVTSDSCKLAKLAMSLKYVILDTQAP